jgi:hypothetical protein
MQAATLIVILLVECYLLYHGQRNIFGRIMQSVGKLPAYLLAAPGTILHELSHLLLCIVLGVQTGRVRLFQPVTNEDGSITLGYVEHEKADPLRGALVAIAPLLLVPPLLIGSLCLIFWGNIFSDPVALLKSASWWQILLGGYLIISSAQGAFPSPGDHIGILGAIALILIAAVIYFLLPASALFEAGKYLAIVLALPAAISGLFMIILPKSKYNGPDESFQEK